MSYEFGQIRKKAEPSHTWGTTAFSWRGCCLQVFSRGEASIDDCLSVLEENGVPLGREAHHQGAAARLRTLSAILKNHKFGGHAKVAAKRIEEWSTITIERACLAHGTMVATAKGVTIESSSHDGKSRIVSPPRQFTMLEMLKLLVQSDAAQVRLFNQLGQIKAAARAGKI